MFDYTHSESEVSQGRCGGGTRTLWLFPAAAPASFRFSFPYMAELKTYLQLGSPITDNGQPIGSDIMGGIMTRHDCCEPTGRAPIAVRVPAN